MAINTTRVRGLFPATKKVKYFFNGGVCLSSKPVQEAVRRFSSEAAYGFNADNWQKWTKDVSEAYKLFADLIGAKAEEIVGIPNTSTGTGFIAQMINPVAGSNIVLDDLTYNTVYPFTIREKRGVEIRIAKNTDGYVRTSEIESLVDDKTSAIVVSAVSCWNGFRYDLRELSDIAHGHGAYLVVDAAQQAGAVKLDMGRNGVDFLATCGHKWLLAPPGTGFLYVRKELIEKFDPPIPGWLGITDPWQFEIWHPEFPKTAQRFETGMQNLMILTAAKSSLQMIHKLGPMNIQDEILKRTGYLIEKLRDMKVRIYTPVEKQHRAGIVTFLLKKHELLHKDLLKHSIIAYPQPETVVRNLHWPHGGFRIDPTFFNTMSELDDLLQLVKKYA